MANLLRKPNDQIRISALHEGHCIFPEYPLGILSDLLQLVH